MGKEISLENIMQKLESIELLLSKINSLNFNEASSYQPPSSFQPGGKDWFLMASEEERRAFNRKRGQESRRNKR